MLQVRWVWEPRSGSKSVLLAITPSHPLGKFVLPTILGSKGLESLVLIKNASVKDHSKSSVNYGYRCCLGT